MHTICLSKAPTSRESSADGSASPSAREAVASKEATRVCREERDSGSRGSFVIFQSRFLRDFTRSNALTFSAFCPPSSHAFSKTYPPFPPIPHTPHPLTTPHFPIRQHARPRLPLHPHVAPRRKFGERREYPPWSVGNAPEAGGVLPARLSPFAAFRYSADQLKVDLLELDCHQTKDGKGEL